jgi:hypothetical protein
MPDYNRLSLDDLTIQSEYPILETDLGADVILPYGLRLIIERGTRVNYLPVLYFDDGSLPANASAFTQESAISGKVMPGSASGLMAIRTILRVNNRAGKSRVVEFEPPLLIGCLQENNLYVGQNPPSEELSRIIGLNEGYGIMTGPSVALQSDKKE